MYLYGAPASISDVHVVSCYLLFHGRCLCSLLPHQTFMADVILSSANPNYHRKSPLNFRRYVVLGSVAPDFGARDNTKNIGPLPSAPIPSFRY